MVKAAPRLLRVRDVLAIVPFSRTTLWRRVRSGSFPAPVRLGERIVAWRERDVRQWVDSRPQEGS